MILRLAATVDGRVAAADGAPTLDPTFVDSMVEPLSVRPIGSAVRTYASIPHGWRT